MAANTQPRHEREQLMNEQEIIDAVLDTCEICGETTFDGGDVVFTPAELPTDGTEIIVTFPAHIHNRKESN